MKILLRINNRALEFQLTWLRYIQAVKYSNQIEENTEDRPLFEARPDTLTPIPVEDNTLITKDNIVSSEAEVHRCNCLELKEKGHDPACRLYNYPDTMTIFINGELTQFKKEAVQHTTPCPCIEGTRCEECEESHGHSGGCTIMGCEYGKILLYNQCYCIREGYVKCFECTTDSAAHSLQCANCDGSTRILSLGHS